MRQVCCHVPERIPYVLLDEQQYGTVVAKWQRCQRQRRAWQNQDMVNNVLRDFKRHLKWAGIKPDGSLSIHTLHKSCCQNRANHLPINVVKELMGHSSISTTQKFYSQTVRLMKTIE
jgi:integrase